MNTVLIILPKQQCVTTAFVFDAAHNTTYNVTEAGGVMSQFYKLLQRIRSMDKNLRFDELRKILEFYDYVMDGPADGSSHKTFRKKGRTPITIPFDTPVKIAYVKKVRDAIENEGFEKSDS